MSYIGRVTAKGKTEKVDMNAKEKSFEMSAEQNEVVSRTNVAKLLFKITIDEEKVKAVAEKELASQMADWEKWGKKDGEKKPDLAEITKSYRESAAYELHNVKSTDIHANKDGELSFPKATYLKFELLQGKNVIKDLTEAEYEYGGGEVWPVDETEYKLQRR